MLTCNVGVMGNHLLLSLTCDTTLESVKTLCVCVVHLLLWKWAETLIEF